MKGKARVLVVAALAIGAAAAGAYLYLQGRNGASEFQGWIEADVIFISPDESGRVESLEVREGSVVAPGALLFTLDADLQKAAVSETEAAVVNARQAYDRAKTLLKGSVGTQKAFDDAEANLRTAEARLNSAKTRLERRRLYSPVSGVIQEIYFRVGEWVSAGRPIISLLPPGNIKVRFFVPQAMLPAIRIGDKITVRCDGCRGSPVARISFISAQAEFTPPIIYSQEERARLVFRVEAIPEQPDNLRAGQPVSVALESPAGASHARR